MFNHISVTPLEKRLSVTSAIVATVDDDEVLLLDLENAGPSTPSDVLPVIGGREQWTHYDLTYTA